MATLFELAKIKHHAIRSDGAKFLDGERNDALDTSWLTVNSSGRVTLGPGLYDELLVVKGEVSDDQIKAWASMGAPFYDSAGNIVYEGAGGQIEMDHKGLRFIRKADNEVTLQMDIETGSAYFKGDITGATGKFSGELEAEKIISSIAEFGGLSADYIKAGTISYDRLNVAYAIVQSAYADSVPPATLTVPSDRDGWNLAVWPNINWREPLPHQSAWYRTVILFNHQTLGTMGESIVVQFSADGITWSDPYIGAYMDRGPGDSGDIKSIGNGKYLGAQLGLVTYNHVQFDVFTSDTVSGRPVDLYVRFRRNAIG